MAKVKENNCKCTNCGKDLHRSPYLLKKSKNHFCSRSCHNGFQKKEGRKTWINIKCDNCGIIRNRRRKEVFRKGGSKSYCSHKCKSISEANEHKEKRPKINCCNCQKPISKPKSLRKDKNFCNVDCMSSFFKKHLKGENNPNYSNGHWVGSSKKSKKKYFKFTESLKERVRIRDKRECQCCGMKEEDHNQRLHVHHIDFDKDNNKLNNLISLCKYCHGKAHGRNNKDYWKVYYQEKLKGRIYRIGEQLKLAL